MCEQAWLFHYLAISTGIGRLWTIVTAYRKTRVVCWMQTVRVFGKLPKKISPLPAPVGFADAVSYCQRCH